MSEARTPETGTIRDEVRYRLRTVAAHYRSCGKHGTDPGDFVEREIESMESHLFDSLAAARREGQAEAWDACATESGAHGWMHDYAVTEMQERNPYRKEAGQ